MQTLRTLPILLIVLTVGVLLSLATFGGLEAWMRWQRDRTPPYQSGLKSIEIAIAEYMAKYPGWPGPFIRPDSKDSTGATSRPSD